MVIIIKHRLSSQLSSLSSIAQRDFGVALETIAFDKNEILKTRRKKRLLY